MKTIVRRDVLKGSGALALSLLIGITASSVEVSERNTFAMKFKGTVSLRRVHRGRRSRTRAQQLSG